MKASPPPRLRAALLLLACCSFAPGCIVWGWFSDEVSDQARQFDPRLGYSPPPPTQPTPADPTAVVALAQRS